MTQATAESLVDAYGMALEVVNDLRRVDVDASIQSEACEVCDCLRDFLVMQLSEEERDQ